jgi:hypothetical protein
MILWHRIRIDGINVDEWVVEIRADEANEPESDKVDIVLANTNGMWTGAFSTVSVLEVWVGHEIMKATYGEPEVVELREDRILTGEIQYVDYTDSEVIIQAACLVATLADGLPKEFHYHPSDVEYILRDVLSTHDKNIPIKIIEYSQDIMRREEVFKSDWTYQDVCNHLAELVGAIWYLDEEGEFVFVDPMKMGEAHNVEKWLMKECGGRNCVGRCNVVTVIGGGVYDPGEYGDEIETTETVRSDPAEGRDEESIAAHGELIAPTFYCPYLTTISQCNKRANALLEYYKVRENIAKPVVAGITVPIRHRIIYSLWGSVQELQVTKRTIEYSSDGYECHLEASAGAVKAAHDSWANVDVDHLTEVPTEEEFEELVADEPEEEKDDSTTVVAEDDYFTYDIGGGLRYLFANTSLWNQLQERSRLFERNLLTPRLDGKGMNLIEYNPTTGDVISSYSTADLRGGYYVVLPWSDTSTSDPEVQFVAWQTKLGESL